MPYSEVRGVALFYADHPSRRPESPAAVLVHGAAGSHLSWPASFRRLPGLRVVLPDLPGHGRSGGNARQTIPEFAEVVRDWLLALRLPPVRLAGHSMGGAVALQLALDFPGLVDRLALINSAARFTVPAAIADALAAGDSVVEPLTRLSLGPAAPAAFLDSTHRLLSQTPYETLRADFAACALFDVRPRLPEVAVPTLVVASEQDEMVAYRDASLLAELIPGSALVSLPGAHLSPVLAADRIVAHLLAHFAA